MPFRDVIHDVQKSFFACVRPVGGCGRDTPSKPALWAVVGGETEIRTCAVSSLWAVVGGRPRDAFTS